MKFVTPFLAWLKGKPSVARCYSHVLHFPNQKPFDNPDLRWPGFIGEFVQPIVTNNPEVLYWFSFYTTCAKFRIYTADYDKFRPELEALRDKLGLEDRGEEKDYVMENDLGGPRFHGPNSKFRANERAVSVLRALKAASDLMVESVIQRADGYWEFEANGDAGQNPMSAHRFSVCHLFHNLMDSDALAYTFEDTSGKKGVLSYYYFQEYQRLGMLSVKASQAHTFKM